MDLDLIEQGGPVVIVLIGLSVVGLSLVFLKLFHYRHYSTGKLRNIEGAIDLWVEGDKLSLIHISEPTRPY